MAAVADDASAGKAGADKAPGDDKRPPLSPGRPTAQRGLDGGAPIGETKAPPKRPAMPSSSPWKRTAQWTKVRGTVQATEAMADRVVEAKVFGKDSAAVAASIQRRFALKTKLMVHPNTPWRRHWDVLLVLFVLVTLFWTPFQLAFDYDPRFSGEGGEVFWAVLEVMMLVFFLLDIVVNFRTAIWEDGDLVQDPGRVASIYVRTWFLIDLLATMPFDLFAEAAEGSLDQADRAVSTLPRMLRFLRLVKLTRILRVFRIRKLLSRMDEMSIMASHLLRFARVGFYIVVIGHVLGCGFWFVGTQQDPSVTLRWYTRFGLDQPGVAVSEQYAASVYWAFVTVTTVGYGDVVPVTDAERVYVIFGTIVGNCIFAFLIGKITALAYQVDAVHNVFQERMDQVNQFLRYREVPRELRLRVRAYYEQFWGKGIHFNEKSVLRDLSFSLRRDVAQFLNKDIIRGVPLFKGANEYFVDEFIGYLRPLHCLPGDFLMQIGEVPTDMYILRKGAVDVMPVNTGTYTLTNGSFFGEIGMVFPSIRRTATVKAVVPTELAALAAGHFRRLTAHFPNFGLAMDKMARVRLEQHTGLPPEEAVLGAQRMIREHILLKRQGAFGPKEEGGSHGGSFTVPSEPKWLRQLDETAARGTPKRFDSESDPAASGDVNDSVLQIQGRGASVSIASGDSPIAGAAGADAATSSRGDVSKEKIASTGDVTGSGPSMSPGDASRDGAGADTERSAFELDNTLGMRASVGLVGHAPSAGDIPGTEMYHDDADMDIPLPGDVRGARERRGAPGGRARVRRGSRGGGGAPHAHTISVGETKATAPRHEIEFSLGSGRVTVGVGDLHLAGSPARSVVGDDDDSDGFPDDTAVGRRVRRASQAGAVGVSVQIDELRADIAASISRVDGSISDLAAQVAAVAHELRSLTRALRPDGSSARSPGGRELSPKAARSPSPRAR